MMDPTTQAARLVHIYAQAIKSTLPAGFLALVVVHDTTPDGGGDTGIEVVNIDGPEHAIEIVEQSLEVMREHPPIILNPPEAEGE